MLCLAACIVPLWVEHGEAFGLSCSPLFGVMCWGNLVLWLFGSILVIPRRIEFNVIFSNFQGQSLGDPGREGTLDNHTKWDFGGYDGPLWGPADI